MKQAPKYHNVKTRGYDSAKEAERARVLHLLEKAGKIRDLREQVRIELIPAQYDVCTKTVPGKEIAPGKERMPENVRTVRKCVERAVYYVADFFYVDCATGEEVWEDAKGVRTKEYIIKRKLMLWIHGIKIKEV